MSDVASFQFTLETITVYPQGVHRKGRQIRFQPKAGRSLHRRGCTKGRQSTTQQAACGIDTKGLITKSGNLLLNKLSAKLTQPQQHTLLASSSAFDEQLAIRPSPQAGKSQTNKRGLRPFMLFCYGSYKRLRDTLSFLQPHHFRF